MVDIVSEFEKLGFKIATRGWFSVSMTRGNANLSLHEKESTVEFETEKGQYNCSLKMQNEVLLELFKRGKENEIKTFKMPF